MSRGGHTFGNTFSRGDPGSQRSKNVGWCRGTGPPIEQNYQYCLDARLGPGGRDPEIWHDCGPCGVVGEARESRAALVPRRQVRVLPGEPTETRNRTDEVVRVRLGDARQPMRIRHEALRAPKPVPHGRKTLCSTIRFGLKGRGRR